MQIAPTPDSSNLTAHLLKRRMYAPSLAASGEAIRRTKVVGLAYSTDAQVAPPAMKANDHSALRRQPTRPAHWPYFPPRSEQAAADEPAPDQPYLPHRTPPVALPEPYAAYAPYKTGADLSGKLLDLYA